MLFGVVLYAVAFAVFVYGNVRASRSIHQQLIESVLGTTLRYLSSYSTSVLEPISHHLGGSTLPRRRASSQDARKIYGQVRIFHVVPEFIYQRLCSRWSNLYVVPCRYRDFHNDDGTALSSARDHTCLYRPRNFSIRNGSLGWPNLHESAVVGETRNVKC